MLTDSWRGFVVTSCIQIYTGSLHRCNLLALTSKNVGGPMHDPARVKRRYQQFADTECRGYSDAYYALALAVCEDNEMVGFIAEMPVMQPNLFFAAIQFLTGPESMPRNGAELRAFVRQRGREIGELMRSRATQTNEVGRCAVLLSALPSGPLALLEVGASAGLCLLLDRFYYELGSARIGDVASPVHLRCVCVGTVALPAGVPQVVWRRGLDIHPIDVHDDDAMRWLLACVYADHHERRQRLEAAVGLARARSPIVVKGDLVDDLPALLAEVPRDAQLVVFHSAVLTYVKPDRRDVFAGILAEASKERDIVWLSNEPPGVVREVAALSPAQSELRFLLSRTRFVNWRRYDELLALAHPHGAAVEWL
jgi:hypothetical protein